jgi:hypothetical protein
MYLEARKFIIKPFKHIVRLNNILNAFRLPKETRSVATTKTSLLMLFKGLSLFILNSYKKDKYTPWKTSYF